jgi:predicted SprT family Zn-dependent metalloprotease
MEDELIDVTANFTELKRECIRRVERSVETINKKLGIDLDMPRVVFSIHGTTAGRAYWLPNGQNKITFNPTLLRINEDEFLNRTPAHEVAHLAAYTKFGTKIRAHGDEWGRCCWCLGIPAIRCHNYDVGEAPTRATQLRKLALAPKQSEHGIVRATEFGRVTQFED